MTQQLLGGWESPRARLLALARDLEELQEAARQPDAPLPAIGLLIRPPRRQESKLEALRRWASLFDREIAAVLAARDVAAQGGSIRAEALQEAVDVGARLLSVLLGQPGQDPVEAIELRKFALARAIAELPENERILLTLRYYENLPTPDIGRLLGVPPIEVDHQLRGALDRLGALVEGNDDRLMQSRSLE